MSITNEPDKNRYKLKAQAAIDFFKSENDKIIYDEIKLFVSEDFLTKYPEFYHFLNDNFPDYKSGTEYDIKKMAESNVCIIISPNSISHLARNFKSIFYCETQLSSNNQDFFDKLITFHQKNSSLNPLKGAEISTKEDVLRLMYGKLTEEQIRALIHHERLGINFIYFILGFFKENIDNFNHFINYTLNIRTCARINAQNSLISDKRSVQKFLSIITDCKTNGDTL
jgi:hypothetical protein